MNGSNASFKKLFYITACTTVAALAMFVWQAVQANKIKSAFGSDINVFMQLEKDIEFLSKLNKADGSFILNEDFENAKQSYKEILKTADEKYADALRQRIAQIEELQKRERADTASYVKKLRENNMRIKELEEGIFNMDENLNASIASMKTTIENLKGEIARKDKELSRKESVQTISFKNENGNLIHYLGEVVNGKANGGGVGIWSTGSIYRGEWKNNQRHGKGEFEWAIGEKYSGEYLNDKRHGEGAYYWPSGERYEGEWRDDKRDGFGTLYDQDGNTRYKGVWKDDKPQK